MFETLVHAIRESGKTIEVASHPDGSRLAILPYGARVLGLFAPEEPENFFWTNPPLQQPESARALFARSSWHNTGGDRTWIAPEIDTFFPSADSNAYWQPRQLDMSDYALERTGGGLQLARDMTLHLARPARDARLRLTKWFGAAPHPLRAERAMAALNGSVAYAGYTQRATLQSLDDPREPAPGVGLWNLLQLPPGGEMLVPLVSPAEPQRCFGRIPDDRIAMDDRLLRIRADFAGSHKIALKAASLCGRTGYVYSQGDRWSLVVRNFFVNPSGEYVDVQRHDPDDRGYAFQMCRVDEPDLGSFCEMEYHAPGLGGAPEAARSVDVSQVWAFRGSHASIDAIARKLLGASV